MKSFRYIFFATILFVASCNKKNKDPEEEVPEEIPVTPVVKDTGFKCADLPPAPVPFGWQDTITDKNKSISAFIFDPSNANRLIFLVDGDISGYNKLFSYDIITQQTLLLGQLGDFLPQVNAKGEIVFSNMENNIILVKNDGSSVELTTNNYGEDPKWDYTGNFIYYFAKAHGTTDSELRKINTAGVHVHSIPMSGVNTATFRKSDKLIVMDYQGGKAYLTQKDVTNTTIDKSLISGPMYSKPGQLYFENLTLDHSDENFYWSNSIGIFKCNIASLKIDTLFKSCPNSIYNNPIPSTSENEMTYSQHVIKPLDSYKLFHQFKAMEINLSTKKSSEIKVFP